MLTRGCVSAETGSRLGTRARLRSDLHPAQQPQDNWVGSHSRLLSFVGAISLN